MSSAQKRTLHALRRITMLVLLASRLPLPVNAQATKAVGEVAGHTLSPVAKEAAEKATKALVEKATLDVGREVAEQTSKSLEAELTKAASEYGDHVLVFARRVPEASAALATRAPQLLPLAEKLGDDILRLEARAPGFGELAAKSYGREDIPRLLKLGERDMRSVVVLSTHATEPRAASLLLDGAEKGGQRFIEQISAKQIIATGLSVATVLAAYRAVGILEKSPDKAIEEAGRLGSKLLSPISYVAAALLAAWGGIALWRRNKPRPGA